MSTADAFGDENGAALAAIRALPTREERDAAITEYAAESRRPATMVLAEVEGRAPAPRAPSHPPTPVPIWRPFPVSALPATLGRYVITVASAIGVDPSFVALPVLVTLAGTIGNRLRVRLKSSWSEPAVLWGAVVARSGRLKSPAIAEVTRPIRRREAEIIERHREALGEHERAVGEWSERARGERGQRPEPPPSPARSLVSDITVEALAERLSESPAGLLLYRDELAGWINGFDAYRSGRGGDVQKWLEMHRAGSIVVDRKIGGALCVPRAAVSIIGSVQPEILKHCLRGEHTANGLAARILFVMPPERPKSWTDAEIPDDVRDGWKELLDSLRTPYDRNAVPIDLMLTDDARELFVGFYDRHAAREENAASDAVAAAFSKIEGAAARFALILQLARDPDSPAVDADAMAAGVELAEWFANEAERLHGTFVETPEDRERRTLIEWIGARGASITVRDLTRGPRRYREPGAAERALLDLVAAGMGRWEERESTSAGGRPTLVFHLGNTGDGDETRSVAGGDETPERGGGSGQTPATKPYGAQEVSSPSPPHEMEKTAFRRHIDRIAARPVEPPTYTVGHENGAASFTERNERGYLDPSEDGDSPDDGGERWRHEM